jgi:RNA polymerase sigma-70 factor (ECF subfamily)
MVEPIVTRRPGNTRRPAEGPQRSVADLVARARDARASIHEQHAAFSALVARFEEMAFVTALRACGDTESARDACQDAFLAAWRKLSLLREPSAFGAWIKRLVRTQCARARRRRSAEVPCTPEAERVADHAGDASHLVSRRETETLIRHTIQRLPAPEREAILLFYFLGEPLSVMARALGISAGNAGKRVYQARLRLRRMLPGSITEPILDALASPSFVRLVERGLLDDVVGEYRFDQRPSHTLSIRREGNRLVCYGGGQRNVLAGRNPTTLVPREFDGEGRFRRDGNGKISHFVYYEFGRRLGVARKTSREPPTPS